MTDLRDLGDLVAGDVIDANVWNGESRIRRLRPRQQVTGRVVGVYPHAPRVVEIQRYPGENALVVLGGPS